MITCPCWSSLLFSAFLVLGRGAILTEYVIQPENVEIGVGETLQYEYVGKMPIEIPGISRTVMLHSDADWRVANPRVAKVSLNGEITAVGGGETEIIANEATTKLTVAGEPYGGKIGVELNLVELSAVPGGDEIEVEVRIKDWSQNPLVNKTIMFFVDGEKKMMSTDENGLVSTYINAQKILMPGEIYEVRAEFMGDQYYESGSDLGSVTINKFESKLSLDADWSDGELKLLAYLSVDGKDDGGNTIRFYYNKDGTWVYITEALTDYKGKVQVKIPFRYDDEGKYNIKATYLGDELTDTASDTDSIYVKWD